MDNRYTFFNKRQSTETLTESVESVAEPSQKVVEVLPPSPPPPISEPIRKPPVLSNLLSRIIGNPNILQLVLLGIVFFMGQQFGGGCQKQKQIRQQIKAIEAQHQKTLRLVDSLQIASSRQETAALQQINEFYATLQQLDLKSAVVKEQLQKAKTTVENRKKVIVSTIDDNNKKVDAQIKASENRSNYFGMPEEDN
jgi:hypothetical protein